MADNITLNVGTGGEVLATDDVSGAHYQLVKLVDGTADGTTLILAGNGVHGNALRVTLASDSTGQLKLAAGTATVGEVTIGAATTAAGDLAKAEDAVHASGDVGIQILAVRQDTPADLSGTDGDYEPLSVSNGRLWVSAQGEVDHADPVSGNPVLMGSEAIATDGTAMTSVTEGDLARLRSDLNGRILISHTHPNLWDAVSSTGAAQTNTVLKAATASLCHYITDITYSTLLAQTIALDEDVGGGNIALMPWVYLAANSTVTISLKTPIRVTENTNIGYSSTATTSTSVFLSGYTAP